MRPVLFAPVLFAIALAIATSIVPATTYASVHAPISKSGQTMDVYVRGVHYYSWPVSTGRGRYATPSGTFRPQRLERRWYSTKFNNAPMHYAVFYSGGYAIHATVETRHLGRPASHGCVRLAPSHARKFFSLVSSHGPGSTRITITH
ncbi:L,D-transpeptidase [Hyphomicrobium sp. CS1GBMeth3]|uniref:L,D-transpeptidase n=1 Tax=Hyphomicrobium sp. CS1GBMeth3 TaxID=1892845 RepID=UPI000930546D|nr:L,D-transpeptidase [Hyphomicrobium sp. CS1GBMeth3]